MATTQHSNRISILRPEQGAISLDPSFSHNSNDEDDELNMGGCQQPEENAAVFDDFVPPPSCWFESVSPPVVKETGDCCAPGVADGEGSVSNSNSNPNPNFVSNSISNTVSVSNELDDATKGGKSGGRKESDSKCANTHINTNTYQGVVGGTGNCNVVVGNTNPSPSWKEISSQVLPAAARELLSSSLHRICYTAKLSYSKGRWHRKYSDMGHNAGGFSISKSSNIELPPHLSTLLPVSTLPWVDRQLVREWRSYLPETPDGSTENEDFDFEQARTKIPNQIPRPVWQKADVCHSCHKPFGPVRLRHHCRSCGHSFCQDHSLSTQRLPHLGYDHDVPERVCDSCKARLEDLCLAERVAWRLARCRDHSDECLTPYFETGIDSAEDVAIRITKAAIVMAKSIPLGAQATIAVETVDVLRKHGLHGIYGIMMRQEFLAAADLLRKALGINKSSWPLSVHELSAAIFYALAEHRAMRGLSPEREHSIHRFRSTAVCRMPPFTDAERGGMPSLSESLVTDNESSPPLTPLGNDSSCAPVMIDSYRYKTSSNQKSQQQSDRPLPTPTSVCDPVPDTVLGSAVFYAPIALNFIYATKEVEMQLLAGQQGWRLLYAYLHQDTNSMKPCDRPASAIFVHREHKIACLSIRGTATINDVITDIRQTPVPFPCLDFDNDHDEAETDDGDWTSVDRGQGLALCGMASAASNLFFEHIDSIHYFVKQGYRIRLVGHSLGGGVATMMGVLVLKYLEHLGYSNLTNGIARTGTQEETALLKVYAYGTPSCFDAKLAGSVDSFVTTVVLHDDVFPRLTPTSCRGLLKHLLHIRETWVDAHIEEDLRAVGERAKTAWAPRFRQNFALRPSPKSIKKYCKKQILRGTIKLLSVKHNTVGKTASYGEPFGASSHGGDDTSKDDYSHCVDVESPTSDQSDWGEKFFVPTANLSMPLANSEDGHERDRNGTDTDDDNRSDASQIQPLLEFLGAGGSRKLGVVIHGDEFFEATENLIAESEEESMTIGDECFSDPIGELADEESQHMSDSWSLDPHGKESFPKNSCSSIDNDSKNDPAAVVLDESPLPRMFLPGKVIHVYSHRGVYKAAYVPRTFKELRRISLAGNMLSNHTAKSYYECLLEVQSVRKASEAPPKWTAYDEDNTCCCCANRFTWASTSDSEAQEARDKHNCRSCGGLVCDPCSQNRAPIPSIGLAVPARICDRCYNDFMGGVSAAPSSMTSSVFPADPKNQQTATNCSIFGSPEAESHKPERTRQKRSVVVDELVSKIHSSALR